MSDPQADDAAASPPRVAPSLGWSLVPVVFLLASLGYAIRGVGADPHLPLVAASVVAALVAIARGQHWAAIEAGMLQGLEVALKPVLILLLVGILIGVWMAAGTVPQMIVYGLDLLSPRYFLVSACLLSALVSLATGSSWSTAGTVGVALVGIGQGLQVPLPMVAGAIVSGAYFGDKMSPLSDTTNLAAAVAGSELFGHIRHMVYSTVPGYAIALVLFSVLGFSFDLAPGAVTSAAQLRAGIGGEFVLGPWLLLPAIVVLGLVMVRVPALPALCAGIAAGGLCGWVAQPGLDLGALLGVAQEGFVATSEDAALVELLNRGGLGSMYWTVGLILCAMTFGGVMEATGMLGVIAAAIGRCARSAGTLILAVVGSCLGMNVMASDQYLAIVLPGRMFRRNFSALGLDPRNLSRALEDSGTLTSPLVPWNTCGAYMATVLGVATAAYLPYAFFNLVTPLISILLGFTGWTLRRTREGARGIPA